MGGAGGKPKSVEGEVLVLEYKGTNNTKKCSGWSDWCVRRKDGGPLVFPSNERVVAVVTREMGIGPFEVRIDERDERSFSLRFANIVVRDGRVKFLDALESLLKLKGETA